MSRATYMQITDLRLLENWARQVRKMFPANDGMGLYQVGSSLLRADYRDVDMRLMMADGNYAALEALVRPRELNLAVSLWGQRATGLPIDFQVQQQTEANAEHNGRRSAVGIGDA